MSSVINQLEDLLEGLDPVVTEDYVDFTLKQQNEVQIAKGITPSAPANYVPVTKKTVTYIVMAAITNDAGDVLFMQEAKSSCAGQWYLPAGKVEPGEDLETACKREVKEETGLEIMPTTLLAIETASGSWFRFVMTGDVLGGKLKTPSQADSESLQAKWVSKVEELSLRARDVIAVVEQARHFKLAKGMLHPHLLPVNTHYGRLLMRLVICGRKMANPRVHVLVSEKTAAHLPTCEINPTKSIHSTLKKYMTELFGAEIPPHRPHGVLSVAYKPGVDCDGLCISVLVSVRVPLENVCLIDKYTWIELSQTVGDNYLKRMGKDMTVPLNVLR
ncbi:8-oxo-dGDP phosphatase NUDT18-like isoform X1 [Artemia franciscana]